VRYPQVSDSAFDFYRANSCIAYSPDRSAALDYGCFVAKTLMVTNAGGSGARQVFDAAAQNARVLSASWSPDGRSIAFSVGPHGLGTRNPILPAQIALIRSDGSKLKMLTQDPNNNAYPSSRRTENASSSGSSAGTSTGLGFSRWETGKSQH
jgi:Tol biopolymer transport system component